MAKTPTERVRDYRLRHPEMAKKFYAASRAKKKARREAERVNRLARMREIYEAADRVRKSIRMAA